MRNIKRTVAAFATVGLTFTGGTAVANASSIDADRLISGSFFSDLIAPFLPVIPGDADPIGPQGGEEADRDELESAIDAYLAQNYDESPELTETAEGIVVENDEAGWPENSDEVVGLDLDEDETIRCAASLIGNEDLEDVIASLDDATLADDITDGDEAQSDVAEALEGEFGTAVSGDDERTYLIVCMEGEVLDATELDLGTNGDGGADEGEVTETTPEDTGAENAAVEDVEADDPDAETLDA